MGPFERSKAWNLRSEAVSADLWALVKLLGRYYDWGWSLMAVVLFAGFMGASELFSKEAIWKSLTVVVLILLIFFWIKALRNRRIVGLTNEILAAMPHRHHLVASYYKGHINGVTILEEGSEYFELIKAKKIGAVRLWEDRF